MPSFDTPEPISVTLEFDIGTARITASKRTDAIVEVLPSNGADDADVRAAQQTEVTCSGGRLLVKGPKKHSPFGKSGSVDVSIELPTDSDVHGTSPMADFTCEGRLGECRLKTSAGGIRVGEAATVRVQTDHGDVRVDRVTGDAEVTGSGRIVIGEIGGAATVDNLNGETVIGEVTGELRANSTDGQISVGVAHAGVDATSAHGGIRIGEAVRGLITLQTAVGDLEVGVRESTAARFEADTQLGSVHHALEQVEGPEAFDEIVEIRARTATGDIVIRRP
ncbi:DUF4097 family beta strand repeat-containing protein [Streptomyces sp. NPDC050636]|uniref:DUF4097 family beta strand repeat-containing protein n=1 Tax=Streptomyces sp. NPDC050636 TaxID=3154510 RepID=UPI00343941EF